MTVDRAIEILTPGRARYSPAEYEKALELAREALRYWKATSLAPALMDGGLTMELQEAISHARSVAAGNHPGIDGCSKCAKEHAQLADWLDELQIYRQLREQGLLVRLPCKVGDTVYALDEVMEVDDVHEINFGRTSNGDLRLLFLCEMGVSFYDHDVGKTVFLTREEAEAALVKEGATDNG